MNVMVKCVVKNQEGGLEHVLSISQARCEYFDNSKLQCEEEKRELICCRICTFDIQCQDTSLHGFILLTAIVNFSRNSHKSVVATRQRYPELTFQHVRPMEKIKELHVLGENVP